MKMLENFVEALFTGVMETEMLDQPEELEMPCPRMPLPTAQKKFVIHYTTQILMRSSTKTINLPYAKMELIKS